MTEKVKCVYVAVRHSGDQRRYSTLSLVMYESVYNVLLFQPLQPKQSS